MDESKIALNGRVLLRRQRLYHSCSAIEDEVSWGYDIYPCHFFVVFGYLLPFLMLIFTHLFYFLSLVPALYSTIEASASQLCIWYFYHAIAGL
jgi:hypothetical protein